MTCSSFITLKNKLHMINSASTVIVKAIVAVCENKKECNMLLALYVGHKIHQIPDL